MDGRMLLTRIKEGDLDSIDIGDFLDRYLDGKDVSADDIPILDIVARGFVRSIRERFADAPFIEVWRAVVVEGSPEAWAANPVGPSGIGVCWSFEPSGAAPYGGGYRGLRRILHGRVSREEVDWAASCIMNAVKPEQHEIRLLETARAEIIGIYDGDTMRRLECQCVGFSFPAFVAPGTGSEPSFR